ncbi:MAG: DUF2577 domain-containing protein [Selenomonadaceae bacterium]|nr:DUF2577 domain-containing protein [Selenomonadaceae bacterium]
MNNDNPMEALFNTFEGIAKNNQSPKIGIGKVISEEPLQIQYNGKILDEKELWVNDYLLIGHARTAEGEIQSATQPDGHHEHKHEIDDPYQETYNTTDTDLKVGFYVALMPIADSVDGSNQQFIVLAHIKRLDEKYG